MAFELFVDNLAPETTEADLRAAFESSGRKVSAVSIEHDAATGRSRGIAFVRMASAEDADAARRALNGAELDGRLLTVIAARDRGERPEGGFGAKAAGRGGEGPAGPG